MFVRPVKSNGFDGGFHELPSDLHCKHVVLDTIKDAQGNEIGRRITLCYANPAENVDIEIPRDGDVVYFMNDNGDTVNTIHWPPREAPVPTEKKRRRWHERHRKARHAQARAEAGR